MENTPEEDSFVFAVDSLFARIADLTDQRSRRSVRPTWPKALPLILLAKLAGEDTARGIDIWFDCRAESVALALSLERPGMPHRTLIRRILRQADIPQESE